MALGDYRLCDVCSGKAVYDGNGNLREREEEHPDRALVVVHCACVSSPLPEYVQAVQQAMAAADPETVSGSAHWPTTARTLYHEVQRLRAALTRLPVLHEPAVTEDPWTATPPPEDYPWDKENPPL